MRLLRALSAPEKRKFRKFLQSPWFNTRTDVVLLYDYLGTLDADATPDNAAAWHSIAPGQSPDTRQLHLVTNYLSRLAEQFLIQETLAEQPLRQTWLLMEACKKRDLTAPYLDAIQSAENMFDNDPMRNADHFQWGHDIYFEKFYADHTGPLADEEPVQRLFDQLDQAWAARKLRQITLLLNRKKLYQSNLQIAYLNEVVDYAARVDHTAQPVIAAYYAAYMMLTHAETADQYFQQLTATILAQPQVFNTTELRELHLFALNYCIRQINAGHKDYFNQALHLYKAGLDQATLFEKGYLSRFTYHNIVAAGLQCREFEWVEQFMQQYKNKLERTHRDSTFSFNAAKLAYSKEQLQDALGLLQNANYRDLLLNLPAKALLAKIYYELQEHDVLQSHLTAMQTFIHRKRVIGYHRENFLNFIRYTNRLLALNRYDKSAVTALRQQIEAEEPLTEKEWLLSKAT